MRRKVEIKEQYKNLYDLLDNFYTETVNREEVIKLLVEDLDAANKIVKEKGKRSSLLTWSDALDEVTDIQIFAEQRLPYSRYLIHFVLPYFADLNDIDFSQSDIEILEAIEERLIKAYLSDLATNKLKDKFSQELTQEMSFLPSVPTMNFPGGTEMRRTILPREVESICQNLDQDFRLEDLRRIAREEYGLIGVTRLSKAEICEKLADEIVKD